MLGGVVKSENTKVSGAAHKALCGDDERERKRRITHAGADNVWPTATCVESICTLTQTQRRRRRRGGRRRVRVRRLTMRPAPRGTTRVRRKAAGRGCDRGAAQRVPTTAVAGR